LGLVVGAAAFHACWNLLLKQAKNKQLFLMWALLCTVVCLVCLPFLPPVPAQAWPLLICSAVVEALYYISLAWAYKLGDFSQVYPIARGAAPALLTLWSALFLSETPKATGLLGIGLLVIGLIIVGIGSSLREFSFSKLSFPAIAVALLTALCISIYSAIDGAAVRIADPLPYVLWIFALSAIFAAPFILWRYGARPALLELKVNWFRIVLVGLLSLLTYGAVLFAYSFGQVSYAGSVREVSIVFGAFMGWRFLGEGFGMPRIIGSLLIFAGILVIAILG
jgi:drug/metabolite transporter (DMT)-like permease